jgi:hypothetical protein
MEKVSRKAQPASKASEVAYLAGCRYVWQQQCDELTIAKL